MTKKPRRKGIVADVALSSWHNCLSLTVIGQGARGSVRFIMNKKRLIRAGMPADRVPKKLRIIVEEEK